MMYSLDVATPLLCVNMDCSHTVINGGQLVHGPLSAMSVVFLIGWWKEGKEDLLPLMHITDDLRTANESLHLNQPKIILPCTCTLRTM